MNELIRTSLVAGLTQAERPTKNAEYRQEDFEYMEKVTDIVTYHREEHYHRSPSPVLPVYYFCV